MKIGLRGGHSKNFIGAVGIVDEYSQMQKFYTHVSKLLTNNSYYYTDWNFNWKLYIIRLIQLFEALDFTICYSII